MSCGRPQKLKVARRIPLDLSHPWPSCVPPLFGSVRMCPVHPSTKKLSGVQLKDRTDDSVLEHENEQHNFLVSQPK